MVPPSSAATTHGFAGWRRAARSIQSRNSFGPGSIRIGQTAMEELLSNISILPSIQVGPKGDRNRGLPGAGRAAARKSLLQRRGTLGTCLQPNGFRVLAVDIRRPIAGCGGGTECGV